MTIVGIDIGFRHTGLVLVDPGTYRVCGHAVFHTAPPSKKQDLYKAPEDLRACSEMASRILEYLRHSNPAVLIGELPHGGARSSSAARGMGIATGMLGGVVAALPELPALWLVPAQVRQAICGRAGASKLDAQRVVEATVSYRWPTVAEGREHVLDAMAAVLAARESDLVKLICRGLPPRPDEEGGAS